jgi:ADP-heptose:LPS heptosyltransferase
MRIGAKIALTADLLRARLTFRRRGRDPRNTLVIRLDGFGDFSLYLPHALVLREIYPAGEYKITLCANAAWCEIAEKLLPFDNFIPLDVRRYMADMAYRKEMNRRIASGDSGTILQPRFFREPLLEDRLALAAGADTGCAFTVGDDHLHAACGRKLEKRLYDRKVQCPADRHEALKNRIFTDALGEWRETPRPELPPPLPEWGQGSYVVLLPGSGKGARAAWPPERWGRALAGTNLRCTVAGSAAEAHLVSAAAEGIGERAVPLAGILSAWDFARLVANAKLVIGNDTGGIHFAAWCGVPALAVTGGGHPGWYYPYPSESIPGYVRAPRTVAEPMPCYGCAWKCTRQNSGTFPCIAAITPEAVASEIADLLN